MEISKENIIAAYKAADENGKRMLIALFGEEAVKEVAVTERIKTFEDAYNELGSNHPYCKTWDGVYQGNENGDCEGIKDVIAYLKLRIICAALNEGWEPKFTEDEERWYPWFFLYTQGEINAETDDWKKQSQLIETGGYVTDYCGFAYAGSHEVSLYATAGVGSHLCLKSGELATYCGKQFVKLWADFQLIRK